MWNSNVAPSQLGLPVDPVGHCARYPDWAASLSATFKDRKCGANLMEDIRIDD